MNQTDLEPYLKYNWISIPIPAYWCVSEMPEIQKEVTKLESQKFTYLSEVEKSAHCEKMWKREKETDS